MEPTTRTTSMPCVITGLLLLAMSPYVLAHDDEDANEEPFGAAVIIIELTDNDIELQVFADAFDWKRLQVFDPNERMIFDTKARGKLRRQGGLSEIVWASEPSHFLEDEPDYDESVDDFLRRWPQGYYEFEGKRVGGLGPLDSEAYLSHVLAALPEVELPDATRFVENEDGDEISLVPFDAPLLIAWEPVTEQYAGEDGTLEPVGDGTVTIIEYQVIVNQEAPERDEPWIDGGTRRALINLPDDVNEIMIPAEVLEPGATYEIEILAIEESGNASIGVLPFATTGDQRSP